jgi:hypothetical protein
VFNVPEKAVTDMGEVSRPAFILYIFLCSQADENGAFKVTIGEVATGVGMHKNIIRSLQVELVTKAWIQSDENGNWSIADWAEPEKNCVYRPLESNKTLESISSLESNQTSLISLSVDINNKNSNRVLNTKSLIDSNNINNNNIYNKRAKKNSSPRGSRLPKDFEVTPAMVMWFESKRLTSDIETETEKFVNYWSSKTGKDATKLDWVATWRNWMLQAESYGRRNGANKKPTETNRDRLAGYDELFARYETEEGD